MQEAQAAVRKAETAADKTQKDYARAKTLVVQGAIAPQQLDAAQAAAEAAQADLKAARERLDLVKAGSRTDQITAARAQVQQALAQQRSAEKALTLARKGPRTEEIQRAEQAVAQAQAARAAAQAQLRLAQEGARPHQKTIAGRQVREARAALSLAEANRRQVAVRQAEAQAAREQVLQAEAAVRAAEAGLDKFRITARVTGMIDDTHLRVGEVVRTGSAIATEVDFSDTWVTVYVPEPRLSQIVLGQSARVTVDGQPDRTFTGRVRRISQQAEFTPKFVQTQEERTRTVFAVEIAVANDEGLLKPGMPADAVIETQGGVSAAPTGTPPGRRP
ncbi:efflux RND transporter periplasmic adaptor subunit [bacterium]|nr:efflux RND transporter periplasmic adaptor subunit [bacterium]